MLARAARNGNLDSNHNWLDNKNPGDFLLSTIYRLLLPLADFKIQQHKLNKFDLGLVPLYEAIYVLSKHLYYTFSDDFNLAHSQPYLDYDPERSQ